MPKGWITFNATDNWQSDYWTRIDENTQRLLNITVNPTNVTEAVYTGIIHIQTNESLSRSVNLTINISPRLTTSETIYIQGPHNNTTTQNLKLNSTGTIKLVNLSIAYINETLPASWIQLTPDFISEIIENTHEDIEINITVPEFTDPANYTGKINISSYNVPDRIINITMEVPPDGTWHFTPSGNQTNEYGLGHTGQVANLTIHNTGNIPLNFSIQYDNAGDENCLDFGTGGTCIDYTHLNAPPSWESSATDYIFVQKNSTSVLDIWQDNDDNEQHFNVGIRIDFTNSSANPPANTTYMSFDILDQPPSFHTFETKVNGTVKDYVEINKRIDFNVIVLDDVSDFGAEGTKGVNDTETYFNITYPNTTTITIDAAFVEDLPYSGDKDRFEANFTTGLAGNYTLIVHAVDISATPHHINSTTHFYVYKSTTIDVSADAASTSLITSTQGDNVTVPVTISNIGYSTAYNINITSDAGEWWSENRSIGNLAESGQNSTSITVQVPADTPPGAYPVTINITYKHADNSQATNSTTANINVQGNETYSIQGLSDSMTFTDIEHGKTNQVTFNITGEGNTQSNNIYISTSGSPEGIELYLSKDNISFYNTVTVTVENSTTQVIYLNIVVDAGESPGTTNHEFDISLVNSQLEKDYTSLKAFILTDNTWNITHTDNITINGVAGQNTVNEDILIANTGNTDINFGFTLTGNVTPYMNLIDAAKTVQPQQNYSIQLNYTAPQQNNYFSSNLSIDDSTNPVTNISVHFNSLVFELNILNLSTPPDILNGDEINLTVEFKYGADYITENTTYSVFINQTVCPITINTTQDNRTNISCTAPGIADGRTYDLKLQADYESTECGPVQVISISENAIYYKDITAPKIKSKNITDPFEIHTNGTINLTVEDNIATDTVLAQIFYPNSTHFKNLTLANTTLTDYHATIQEPGQIGIYSVTYIINDTTGNINSSVTDTFEIYQWKNFTGIIQDLNSNPVSASFTVKDPSTQQTIATFQTNATGHYNTTLKRKTYDLEMTLLNWTLLLEDADFTSIPTHIIDIDKPLTGDYGHQGTVIKGFAQNSTISTNGNMTVAYTSDEAVGLTTDYFQIYFCSDWDYSQRNCNSGLVKLSSTHDKINRKLEASFTTFSGAYLLVEDEPSNSPEMTIATSQLPIQVVHGNKNTGLLTIQSTGSVALSNIEFECSEDTVCTAFTVDADSIIGLDAGASYDAPINVTVPKYYAPGIYDGTLVITSNKQSVYMQYKEVTLKVTVPEDDNWTAPSNLTLDNIGGGLSGDMGPIALKNLANVPIDFTATVQDMQYLSATPDQITISKNNTDYIYINYSTPDSTGFYNYSINITGAGNTKLVYATINVTHAVNITSIQPNENISMGGIIEVNATAQYLNQMQTDNVTWQIYIDDTPCTTLEYNYTNSTWSILCTAPNMSAKLYYTLKLQGKFTSYSDQIAHDTAYDLDNIYYVDILAPQIESQTPSCERTDANTTVDAVITDYSNVSYADIEIFAPNGTKIYGQANISHIGNNTYSFQYNFTLLGDHIIIYSAKDTLNNSGTIEQYFEVYRNITFLGDVKKGDNSGQQSTFKFYRQNQSYTETHLLDQFTTYADGSYNIARLHDRFYDIEITTQNNAINLNNINLTKYSNDPIDIDIVPGNEVQITGTTELGGIAVNTNIISDGSATISYIPDSGTKEDNIYIYKCEDWNYTETKCDGTWEVQARGTEDLNKIYNTISVDISGFSAYIAAESVPQVPPGTIIYNTENTGGSSSGSTSISINTGQFEESVGALKEAIEELKSTQVINGVEIETDIIQRQLFAGERTSVPIRVRNTLNTSTTVTLDSTGEISRYIAIMKRTITLGKGEESEFTVEIEMPYNTRPGNYHGTIIVSIGDKSANIPVTVHVLESREDLIKIDLSLYTDTAYLNSSISYEINIDNIGGLRNLDMLIDTTLINPVTLEIYSSTHHDQTINTSTKVEGMIAIPGNITTGEYTIKTIAKYAHNNQTVEATSIKPIKVITIPILWYNKNIFGIAAWKLLLAGLVLSLLTVSGALYIRKEQRKKRYTATVDFKSLPQPGAFAAFVGNIAETGMRAFFDLNKLQTHTIVAGATGGGKTMAAQVLVEEALLKGKNVIVFDPTAQWTGFLRKCTYRKMLAQYGHFQMKHGDARAFNGNVHTVQDSRQVIDIKKYMIPGEIHIFTINKLKPEEIDMFIASTVRQVFQANMDESQELKTLIVYDEVHRLLPKFGGSGDGFVQIERAVREFRKWGIGLVLISQALTDFIGTIKANIGTEIQVRTRDESDLKRIETKYGQDMMKSIIKASVGTGMVENAEYNRGKPYFVTFRPPLHSIMRLSDAELENYRKYNEKIDDLLYQIEQLKAEDIDVFDIELEVKLALDKLKIGSFSMVDIYLESLEPRIKAHWDKLGRVPRAHTVSFIEERDLKNEIEKAKRFHEVYEMKEKGIKKMQVVVHADEDTDLKSGKGSHTKSKVAKHRSKDSQDNIVKLNEQYETLKEQLEKKRREGKDTSLLQIDVVNIPALIQMAETTGDKKDILTARTKMKSIRKELDSL